MTNEQLNTSYHNLRNFQGGHLHHNSEATVTSTSFPPSPTNCNIVSVGVRLYSPFLMASALDAVIPCNVSSLSDVNGILRNT